MCWLFTIHACLLQEAYQSCKSDNEIEAITMSHSRFIIGDDYSKDLTSFYAPFLESLAPSVEEKRPSLDQLEHWKGPEEKAEAELAEKQQRPSGPDVDVSGFDKGNIMRSLSPVLADRTLPPVSIDPRHTLTGDNAPAGLQLPDMTGTTLNNIQETLDEPRTETRAFDPSHKPQSIMDLTPTLLWKIDAGMCVRIARVGS